MLNIATPPGAGMLLLAVVLDMMVGDPQALPHPVRLVGAAADWLERLARRSRLPLRLAGVLGVGVLAVGTGTVVHLFCALPGVGGVLSLYFAFAGLALGSLLRECRNAARAVAHAERAMAGQDSAIGQRLLDEARRSVGMLVSRDTSHLNPEQLRRTLAETLSENMGDGFVAPLLFLVVGGPVLQWAYKAVSTLDSMWGYRTEQWRELGWAAARLDDVLAFIPARLTALAMILAAVLTGWIRLRSMVGVFVAVRRDARTMASPNAGWPMAAAAWIMGTRMGGKAVYFGTVHNKPVLGPRADSGHSPEKNWSGDLLDDLLRLCLVSGVLCGLAAVLVLV